MSEKKDANSPEQIERKLRENRICDAGKRGYTGQNSKFLLILRNLGEPIIGHSHAADVFFLDDPYAEPEQGVEDAKTSEEILTRLPYIKDSTMTWYQRPEGWTELPEPDSVGIESLGLRFDGLSRGMHLEIIHSEQDSALKVYYKGEIVYQEIRGELVAYRPIEEWENWIDRLHKVAHKKARGQKAIEFQEMLVEAEKEKANWWDALRKQWGI